MKSIRIALLNLVAAAAISFFVYLPANGQLNAGDILFTGYLANATTTDEFSFVTLVTIPSGTVINFTDNGWLSTNVLRAGEQTATLTTSVTLNPGTEVRIVGAPAGAATATAFFGATSFSAGTVTGTTPSLATSGDQVLAYRGTTASPTMLAAIHMNVYATDLGQCSNTTAAALDPTCIADNANFSVMPTGLAAGVSTIWIGTVGVGASEQDNAVFNCTGPLGTAAQIRAAVTNSANWNANSVAPPNFTIPSRCNFFGSATAAGVVVGGRVVTADGRGVRNALVTIISADGTTRTARTSSFGYYRFNDVVAGETYTLTATAKQLIFTPQVLFVGDGVSDANIIAEP